MVRMDARLTEIHDDVRLIKSQVEQLVKQGAVHNYILEEHQKRSTQLETRVSPLEDSHKFQQTLVKYILGSSGALGAIAIILSMLKH